MELMHDPNFHLSVEPLFWSGPLQAFDLKIGTNQKNKGTSISSTIWDSENEVSLSFTIMYI